MANSRKAARAVDAQGLLKHLHYFLENHLPPKADVTLGLSGGLDSCVLLHLLVQLRQPLVFQLSAIHVNHQISPNAGEWASFCEQLCADLSVPLQVIKVDVPRNSGLGLEAAAREARYGALLEHGSGTLLLAHHQDDQAETLLLQLLRGAGVNGMSAMARVSQMGNAIVLRPLLDISKVAIQIFAEEVGLHWVEDASNQDSRFDRNFLRNEVMPMLRSRFPACAATLARSAANFADSSAALEQLAELDALDTCFPGRLDTSVLKSLSQARATNLLSWWIRRETGLTLSRVRLHEVLNQLCAAKIGAQVECRLNAVTLRRYRRWAYMDHGHKVLPYAFEWKQGQVIDLPDGSRLGMTQASGAGILAEFFQAGLLVTNRAGAPLKGEMKIMPASRGVTKTLKNLWQESGVPPWERERMPMLWNGNELVAVLNIAIDQSYQAKPGQMGCVISLIRS